jgi:short-subunit dehydrogenase
MFAPVENASGLPTNEIRNRSELNYAIDMADKRRVAIIVGASSGIGEALARELHKQGWSLGLLARRVDRLSAIARDLGDRASVGYVDVSTDDCIHRFHTMVEALGGVDLVIISAGNGHLNPEHELHLDHETTAVNISGFIAIAQAAFRHFQQQGHGHLAAITSVAALRGSADGTVYSATKAFQSVYLDGLRESARQKKLPLTVTELQTGFVDTAMMKTQTPLSPLVRHLLVSDATNTAKQMIRAISRKKKHTYITKRYAMIALLLKLLPRPGK